ncbi:MAG: sigma-70 family RNA polymerase sigma factor, partial [Elusimicrobiota bacterium]
MDFNLNQDANGSARNQRGFAIFAPVAGLVLSLAAFAYDGSWVFGIGLLGVLGAIVVGGRGDGMIDGVVSSDEELIKRYQKTGDKDALAEIVKRYQPVAKQIAYNRTHNASLIEDFAQEALLNLIKSIAGYDPTSPFGNYAKRVMKYRMIDMSLRENRRAMVPYDEQGAHRTVVSPAIDLVRRIGDEQALKKVVPLMSADEIETLQKSLDHTAAMNDALRARKSRALKKLSGLVRLYEDGASDEQLKEFARSGYRARQRGFAQFEAVLAATLIGPLILGAVYLSKRIKAAGGNIRMPWYGFKQSKSLSPVTMQSALAVNAHSNKALSLGSRQSDIIVTGVTKRALWERNLTKLLTSAGARLNLFLDKINAISPSSRSDVTMLKRSANKKSIISRQFLLLMEALTKTLASRTASIIIGLTGFFADTFDLFWSQALMAHVAPQFGDSGSRAGFYQLLHKAQLGRFIKLNDKSFDFFNRNINSDSRHIDKLSKISLTQVAGSFNHYFPRASQRGMVRTVIMAALSSAVIGFSGAYALSRMALRRTDPDSITLYNGLAAFALIAGYLSVIYLINVFIRAPAPSRQTPPKTTTPE